MNLIVTLLSVLGISCGKIFFIAAEIENCNFYDTVNITDSQKLSNGSYLYENVVIPPELIGSYDYDLVKQGEIVTVPTHLRGCVCKVKSCVKFCCHPSEIKTTDSWECNMELNEELNYSPLVNVTMNNGKNQLKHVLNEFVVQQGIPCDNGYPLVEEWELFENGTLLRFYDDAYLSKNEYCLTPTDVNGSYILNPINCPIITQKTFREYLYIITMMISILFMVVTIIIYAAIPELHNLHGKSLICYLIALAGGYALLVVMSFEDIENPFTLRICTALGFICYYCFIAAFFWLSVISFDLWSNFHAAQSAGHRFLQRKRFLMFSIYAWGIPLIMTILTLAAHYSDMDENLKPGIAESTCWLNTDIWATMIYFYGPILILIIFNITMFILTAIKIHQVQKELARITATDGSSKHLFTQIDNFGLFLRLFIVMGVTWLLEVFSFMVGMDNLWSLFFFLPDICNAAQGIIIFVLFVLKRKVKKLIKKRMAGKNRNNYNYSSVYKSSIASSNKVRTCHTGPTRTSSIT